MTWQRVQLDDVPPTRWRNGGGVTRELVAWPHPQAWRWRVSVAEVASSGPFSRFDGVQRWLAILDGAGVRLSCDTKTVELTDHSAPLNFDGADPVDCELLGGSVRDLNLMVRDDPAAGRSSSRMQRIAGPTRVDIEIAKTVVLFNRGAPAVLRTETGSVVVPADTLAWQTLPAGCRVEIEADAAIWMEIDDQGASEPFVIASSHIRPETSHGP